MRRIRLGAAALNQTPMAWDENRDNIVAAIAEAREAEVRLLCLPELCISGYNCEDAFHAPGLVRSAESVLLELLPETRGIAVSLGLPILMPAGLFNAAAMVVDGELLGFAAKQFLAGDGIHYEPRWFKAWRRGYRSELRIGGRAYPVGDLHFDIGGLKVGFEICEDAWVADRPGAVLARRGIDVILNPSASHFAFEKFALRQRFVTEGSRAFASSYVYANLLGNEAGRAIYDGGALIAEAGRLVAVGPRLGFGPRTLTTAVVDVDATRMKQARTIDPQPEPHPESCVSCDFEFPEIGRASREVEVNDLRGSQAWERSPDLKSEEFSRAVTLGLFDYFRKSRSRGAVVSLSGGADSAAVACLVAMMVRRAEAELGRDAMLARLGQPALSGAVSELLMTVYQATANSSETTRSAAANLAEALGAEHLEFDVEPLVAGYVSMVEAGIARRLEWERDDIALQNIQARARAPGVWMLANLRGALLLSTSNRSEAAVGYATMDGDTAGGLSPIAGIDKAFLREWLHWLEVEGPEGLGPIPALRAVNEQQPTAELRPSDQRQTDEDDLMPYPLLDAIERAAIRDKKMPVEVYDRMREHFPEYGSEQLLAWVERFFQLWCRNQWKRERYAPSFHLDDENLDPKTWCRFPILSGGFERELAELRRHAAVVD